MEKLSDLENGKTTFDLSDVDRIWLNPQVIGHWVGYFNSFFNQKKAYYILHEREREIEREREEIFDYLNLNIM